VPTVRVRSLAKINLDLRVLNKRPDDFHELRTVFQTISLADVIDIEYERGRTRIDLESNFNIPENLIVKAADAVLEATHSTARLRFRLRKRIPMGGGLGGGSSNAAAVLLALPVLLRKRLPLEKMMEIASSLGSDIPFFLLGGTAVGLGRGTELYPLPDIGSRPALLVTPDVHVSTAEAYRALNRKLTIELPSSIINSFEAFVWCVGGRAPGPNRGFVNDFENVVFRQHPQLKSIKGKLLKLGAQPALMSGSGSALFGIFGSRELRDSAVASIRRVIGNDKIYPVSMTGRHAYRVMWWRQLAGHIDDRTWPPQSQRVVG
jgi:4-diphosphocytidyl-2-C-methyl-D-erythritol kinase